MGKKKDLTGQKFERLLVLEDSGKRASNGNVIWKCLCDCGKIVEVPGRGLIIGDNKSCGCLNKELYKQRGKKNSKDLTNQRFGKLIAIEPTEKREQGSIVWKCLCDCGNITEVSSRNLIHHKVGSCGCRIRSLGEQEIENILQQYHIIYQTQIAFSNLKGKNDKGVYRFDFGIYDKNNTLLHLIEFDGRQHFEESFFTEIDSLEDRKYRDKIKDDYCKTNNIPLIRIPYTKLGKITIDDLLI